MALASLVAISGPKKSRFQGPSLPMALVMDSARIKILCVNDLFTEDLFVYSSMLLLTEQNVETQLEPLDLFCGRQAR